MAEVYQRKSIPHCSLGNVIFLYISLYGKCVQLQHPLPITGDDIKWLTIRGSNFEFMIDQNNPDNGFSSLAYPWQVYVGFAFSIDVSMIESPETAKLHIKVKKKR